MRYDTPVYFQSISRGDYNAATGNWDADTTSETMRYASIQATRKETAKLVYGDVPQESVTIHLQNHYRESYDHIRIGEKIYDVDRRVRLRTKDAFIAHEV